MNKYILHQSPKTKTLNFFRNIFRLKVLEKILVKNIAKSPFSVWTKLVPPDYLYPKGSMREVVRSGIRFSLDISNVVDHHLYFGFREASWSNLEELIRNAEVIFDIGANVGSTAMHFAKLNPTARIIAFEPHPNTFSRALHNISLNNFTNIDFQMIGFGERNETVKLYEVNQNNPGMNRILVGPQDFPFVEIKISTIDEFVSEHNISSVGLIKIDIEGFEYLALKGGEHTIRSQKPALFIELDDNNLKEHNASAKDLIMLLKSFGYTEIFRTDTFQELTELTDYTNCHYDIIAKQLKFVEQKTS